MGITPDDIQDLQQQIARVADRAIQLYNRVPESDEIGLWRVAIAYRYLLESQKELVLAKQHLEESLEPVEIRLQKQAERQGFALVHQGKDWWALMANGSYKHIVRGLDRVAEILEEYQNSAGRSPS